jgi:hypothetical protein
MDVLRKRVRNIASELEAYCNGSTGSIDRSQTWLRHSNTATRRARSLTSFGLVRPSARR